MIRTIEVNLNAAHPELPLVEATTFVGAPSAVFIRGVPPGCGEWKITAVNVAVSYPDNTTTTRAAVRTADGIWTATIPGTATSGRTPAGLRILADGIDENGNLVTGYVLGFADFAVLSFSPVPAPGETFWPLRYFDTAPAVPKKGDSTTIDGVLKFYNGTVWAPFADLSNYYTAQETDEAIERVAAYYITYNAQGAAFPTTAALLTATTVYSGGVVRVPTRNDYAVVLADETHGGAEWRYIYAVADGATTGQWEAQYPVEGVIAYDNTVTPTSGNGVKSSGIWSAIWGALAALPTGFASLYDWCVAQFAKYLPLTGGTMTGDLTAYNLISKIRSVSIGGEVSGAKFILQGASNEHYIQFAYQNSKYGLFVKNGANDTGTFYALADFATLASPAFTGTPTAPTPTAGDNSTKIATTAFVQGAVSDKANRAASPTAGNLAALDANGNPTDAGYHFEVRNGIPCIVQYT